MSDPVIVPAIAPAVVVDAASKAPAAIALAGYGMLALGVILIAMLWWIFFKAQEDKHNKIDLTDLLIDQAIGKTTQGRFWGLVGGAAGTWVFIYLPVSGHFDATYASAYLVAVFALKVAGDITGKPDPGTSSQTTTTTTVHAAPVVAIPDLPSAQTIQDAGRGVEPLKPAIGPEDVGKSVAIVSKRKPTKKGKK